MRGYHLTPQAADAEARYTSSRKSIVRSFSTSSYSRHDGDNFRTNRVTLAEFDDRRVADDGAAIGLAATWACVNLLAGTIASLPLMVYRMDRDGVRNVAKDHPLYRLLHDRPNFDQTALDFLEFICASIELHGNGYAQLARGAGNSVTSLTPVRPDLMQVRRRGDGSLVYEWTDKGKRNELPQEMMLHVRGFGGGPLGGASTLSVCRQSFGSAIAVERASGTIFGNGIRASGIMKVKSILTQEQHDRLEARLQEKYVGSHNQGRPMVLDNDMTWEQLSIDPSDAQMLESRKFSGEEICRIFGTPPAMVGYGDKASNWGTGKEQDVLGFQKFTLRRRLKRVEMAMEQQLLTPADRAAGVTIEFNQEGLLRGDSDARSKFYQSGLTNGWLTINEVRARENMPPVPGGDVPRMQIQNVPITEAGQLTPPAED